MAEKILFLKLGSFSLINESIKKILHTEFEEYNIEVIDIKDIWKQKMRYSHYLINIYYFIREYGIDYILGYKKKEDFFSWFFGTSYITLQTNKFIQQCISGQKYLFSFQTQCLFNGKIKGVPHFIYTDHTTKTNLLYPNINPRQYIRSDSFIKHTENNIYRDADMIFTCGSLITYSLLNQYNIAKEKAMTVFAGSNVIDRFIANNDKYSSKNILFVGVDWERKGGPLLVKAFEKILQKHKDATLTIVGCKPSNINLPGCNIVGKVSADKLPAYYNQAAIFCLPTLREPFGIVFVEAMHYRLPIIANNIGSIPDMVINDFNGFLLDNNIDDYSNLICKLFEDPEKCKKLGENGYAHAQTNFSWEHTGKTMKSQIIKFL